MSRKWERMVQKNTKTVNKTRAKSGGGKVVEIGQPEMSIYKGRSVMYSIVLLGVTLFLSVGDFPGWEKNGLYWFTVAMYAFLTLFVFFGKRPYLKVWKNELGTRRFFGEKRLEAINVQKISLLPGYVVIQTKENKPRWVFSRLFNRFDTERMGAHLQQFATAHHIPIEIQENKK